MPKKQLLEILVAINFRNKINDKLKNSPEFDCEHDQDRKNNAEKKTRENDAWYARSAIIK